MVATRHRFVSTLLALFAACAFTIIVAVAPNSGVATESTKTVSPAPQSKSAATEKKLPDFAQVQRIVDAHFAAIPGRKSGDLISKSDVQTILAELRQIGWTLRDEKDLLQQVLDDNHFLVQQLHTPAGEKFMRKTASYGLIYDRLERIADERGGQQLLRDLIKLPDAEKYAQQKTARAVPNLVDFLPKDASGKTRTVKNYEKPTGHLYTADDLLRRLQELHRQETKSEKQRETKQRTNG